MLGQRRRRWPGIIPPLGNASCWLGCDVYWRWHNQACTSTLWLSNPYPECYSQNPPSVVFSCHIDPMLAKFSPRVVDDGPTLCQHWVNVLCVVTLYFIHALQHWRYAGPLSSTLASTMPTSRLPCLPEIRGSLIVGPLANYLSCHGDSRNQLLTPPVPGGRGTPSAPPAGMLQSVISHNPP